MAVAVVMAILAAAAVSTLQGDPEAETSETKRSAVVEIQRGEVAARADYDGTLGYGDAGVGTSGASGVVTRLAAEGDVVKRGQALWRVNQRPVVLLLGGLPFYRPLGQGADGLDVLILERNLKALGFADALKPNRSFDSETSDAVERFQEAKGLPETGVLDPADVVVRRESARVVARRVDQGSLVRRGQPILGLTGSSRLVTFAIDPSEREIFEGSRRAAATITLPDGEEVQARSITVGTVTASEQGRSTSQLEARLKLPRGKVSEWGEIQVDVSVVSQRKEDVLYVPVTALLALAEGGYGLELIDGEQTRLVGVTVGLIADGRAEVSGSIAAGQKVVAAA